MYEDYEEYNDDEIMAILEEYNKKRTFENMCGPAASMFTHAIVLTLLFLFIVGKVKPQEETLTVQTMQMEEVILEDLIEDPIKEEFEEPIEEMEEPDERPPNEKMSEVDEVSESLHDVSDEAPSTDDDMPDLEVLDHKLTNSPLKFRGPIGGRAASGRRGLVQKGGGGIGGQIAVDRALRWLARVQHENGSWENNSAHSGLALLTFLAHGETPMSEKYGRTIQKAIQWLVKYGSDDLNVKRRPMAYSHGIATYALCEAYAMTKLPMVRVAMEKCLDALIDGQMDNGGFGYGYTKGARWDNSVAGWNVQALKAGLVAGSSNPKLDDAIKKAIKFYKTVAFVGGNSYSGFGYAGKENGNNGISQNLTGTGVVCLQLLGEIDCKQVTSGLDYINMERIEQYEKVAKDPSQWNKVGGDCLYGWYYDTQAVYNGRNTKAGKAAWVRWRNAFETVLKKSQNPEGYWQTNGKHKIGTADTGGRVLATCLSSLQLMVYYRYLPTFDIKKMNQHNVEIEEDDIEDLIDF